MARHDVTCVVDARAELGEGPLWDAEEQALYWVDIAAGVVHRFDPAAGEDRTWSVGEPVGCLAVRRSGGLVLATASGFWLYDPGTGDRTQLVDPEEDLPHNRFNDGITDPAGRFWAGTMNEDDDPAPTGGVYRLDPDRTCHRWTGDMVITNGLAFSPDGGTMYVSDSGTSVGTVWACDYDLDSGTPSNRRVFFDTGGRDGRPDGGTVDADGCYWLAAVGGGRVLRLTPAGTVDRVVEMPVEMVTKPMFGGPDLDVLYVTSLSTGLSEEALARQPHAGGLFAVTGLGVQGVPQTRFAG